MGMDMWTFVQCEIKEIQNLKKNQIYEKQKERRKTKKKGDQKVTGTNDKIFSKSWHQYSYIKHVHKYFIFTK